MSKTKCTTATERPQLGVVDLSLAACIDRVKTRTHQFARRQETWFRSLSECRFVEMSEGESPDAPAERIRSPAANVEST